MSMLIVPADKMPRYFRTLHAEVVHDGVLTMMRNPNVTTADIDSALALIEREIKYFIRAIDEQTVHCGQCEHFFEDATPHDEQRPHFCTKHGIDLADGSGYCAWSERKKA